MHSKKLNLVFPRIPKNASSSVMCAIIKADKSVDNTCYHHTPLKDIHTPGVVFAIVRDPVDRFLSTCAFVKDMENVWRLRQPHHKHVEDTFITDMSTGGVAWLLYKSRHLLGCPGVGSFSDLWFPQKYFITSTTRKVDKFFDFSNLDPMWDWLETMGVGRLHENKSKLREGEKLPRRSLRLLEEIYAEDFELYHSLKDSDGWG